MGETNTYAGNAFAAIAHTCEVVFKHMAVPLLGNICPCEIGVAGVVSLIVNTTEPPAVTSAGPAPRSVHVDELSVVFTVATAAAAETARSDASRAKTNLFIISPLIHYFRFTHVE
jgi:hypothetical protein